MRDDQNFNISFVSVIEKHEILYNTALRDYSNKVKTEKEWLDVSAEVGYQVEECKKRWKNIRGAFQRDLRTVVPSGSSAKPKRQYYLFENLQFIMPYVKPRDQTGNLPATPDVGSFPLLEGSSQESACDSQFFIIDEELVECEIDATKEPINNVAEDLDISALDETPRPRRNTYLATEGKRGRQPRTMRPSLLLLTSGGRKRQKLVMACCTFLKAFCLICQIYQSRRK